MTFRRRALAAALCGSALLAACGGAQQPPEPRGAVRFAIEPAAAIVEVDETRVGPASMLAAQGLLLRPGQHRIVVSLEDHFTEYRLVEVRADEAWMPPLNTEWFVSVRPDPADYPDYKPEFENWTYKLAAGALEVPPWKGTDFQGSGYTTQDRSGLHNYAAVIDGGSIKSNEI